MTTVLENDNYIIPYNQVKMINDTIENKEKFTLITSLSSEAATVKRLNYYERVNI